MGSSLDAPLAAVDATQETRQKSGERMWMKKHNTKPPNTPPSHRGATYMTFLRTCSTHTHTHRPFFRCVNMHARVMNNHGEVLKRWQLMGNQRKQRPWHCGAYWRLTLLYTHTHTDRRTHEYDEPAACYLEHSRHRCVYRGGSRQRG